MKAETKVVYPDGKEEKLEQPYFPSFNMLNDPKKMAAAIAAQEALNRKEDPVAAAKAVLEEVEKAPVAAGTMYAVQIVLVVNKVQLDALMTSEFVTQKSVMELLIRPIDKTE